MRNSKSYNSQNKTQRLDGTQLADRIKKSSKVFILAFIAFSPTHVSCERPAGPSAPFCSFPLSSLFFFTALFP